MMKKKIVSILLTACMMLGVTTAFAGCNKQFDGLVIGYIHYMDASEFPVVEKAFSDYVNEKIGVKVKFKKVSIMNQSIYTTWIAAKEQLDVMPSILTSPLNYIKSKQVRELESLITEENAPYLKQLLEERDDVAVTDVTGRLYGIGSIAPAGRFGGYVVRQDILEELGLLTTPEAKEPGKFYEGQMIDMTDLTPLFAKIKAELPDVAPGKPVYACGNLADMSSFYNVVEYDDLGNSSLTTGAIMDMDNHTNPQVVNFWKSDEYKHFVQTMGEWYDAGYLHPDAAAGDQTLSDLFTDNGQFVGIFSDSSGLRNAYELTTGPLVQLNFMKPSYKYTQPEMSIMIPSTSKRAVDAIKFINLVMEDPYLMNMCYLGVEGKHWNYISEENNVARLTQLGREGYTKSGPFGVGGDRRYQIDTIEYNNPMTAAEAVEHFVKTRETVYADEEIARTRPSPAVGFIYDPGRMAPTIAGLNTVVAKYDTTLRLGRGGKNGTSFTGAGTQYDKFIKELDAAGIESVISDVNTKFQAWFAAKSAV